MAGSKYPGVYPYEVGKQTLYRCAWRCAEGKMRNKRGFASALAASKYRNRQIALADDGVVTAAPKPSQPFTDLFDEFIAARRPYVAKGTLDDYRRHGERRLKPAFAGVNAAKLSDRHVAKLMQSMAASVEDGELAPKTANNALIALTACLSWAVSTRKLPQNVAVGTERLPVDEPERDYLRLNEIALYLDGCSDTYRPLAELLIATGMRISEAIGLRWDDVDCDGGAIRVYRQRTDRGSTGPTKSRKFRAVQVGPNLLQTLRALQARQGEFVPGDLSRATLFVSRGRSLAEGLGPMERNVVSRDWHKDALQAAGLRDMPLHSLRHTAAASWLAAGKTLIYVQRQLGHASVKTTEKIYGHLELSYLSTAAAEVEAFVARGGH